MLGHITNEMELLNQHAFSKGKDNGKHFANKANGWTSINSNINRLGPLNNYIPKTLKIDFPHYNG